MKGAALAALLLLLMFIGAAAQQTPTPRPTVTPVPLDALFQTVKVDQFAYAVDSFYPCQGYVTSRTSKLTTDEEGAAGPVVTTLTIQMFVRSGDQMLAIDAFSTYESELTAPIPVGGTLTCVPQTPVTTSP